MTWVHWAAESVAGYYGRFPVPHLLLRIVPTDGRGVRGGRTFGRGDGGYMVIHVGSETEFAGLANDWMLTHEMVHLSFPSMADDHHWIEEGIATYVEPIARVRAKHFDANEMWFEVVRDMHQGLPAAGDEGLDSTHTWGRTYWGGALFCLLADVEIHRETGNKKGLEDALRGILDAGGDIRYDWPIEKALKIGDQATGVPVLENLYGKMKDQPYDVDLPALWQQLGIDREGDKVVFDGYRDAGESARGDHVRQSRSVDEARCSGFAQSRDFCWADCCVFPTGKIPRLKGFCRAALECAIDVALRTMAV